MIKIGIVGIGSTVSIARMHMDALLKDDRVVVNAIFSGNRTRAEKFISDFSLNAVICETYQELISLSDAVIICTPNQSHFEYAYEAILHNKHVLLEKPMTLNLEEAKKLKALKANHNTVLMIGYVFRNVGVVEAVKKIIEKEFKQIYTINGSFGGKRLANPQLPLEWRMKAKIAGTGALGDFGSHLLDLMHYLTGRKFNDAKSFSNTFIKTRQENEQMGDVETDDASVMILSSTNLLGSITVSRIGLNQIQLTIAGDGGLIQMSLDSPMQYTYWKKEISKGYTGEVISQVFDEESSLWFHRQMQIFINSIFSNPSRYADIDDGYYVQEILEIAQK